MEISGQFIGQAPDPVRMTDDRVVFRCTHTWKIWLREFAEYSDLDVADLIAHSVGVCAEIRSFGLPRPPRVPRRPLEPKPRQLGQHQPRKDRH